jgi:hypothetical protein
MNITNITSLLHWALRNKDEHRARIIANAIIQGTELLGFDLW